MNKLISGGTGLRLSQKTPVSEMARRDQFSDGWFFTGSVRLLLRFIPRVNRANQNGKTKFNIHFSLNSLPPAGSF